MQGTVVAPYLSPDSPITDLGLNSFPFPHFDLCHPTKTNVDDAPHKENRNACQDKNIHWKQGKRGDHLTGAIKVSRKVTVMIVLYHFAEEFN